MTLAGAAITAGILIAVGSAMWFVVLCWICGWRFPWNVPRETDDG